MKKHFYILVLFISTISIGQSKPEEFVDTFFENYQKDGVSVAIDKLYESNPWIDRATDAINNLKGKMEALNKDFVGDYYGYELIVEKKLGDSFILLSYIVKFDRQPIRYTFEFYKPDDTWRVFGLQFDGDLDAEIEESAKLYYLQLGN